MVMESDFESRLIALEQTVAALREQAEADVAIQAPASAGALWALEGLRARAPEGGAVLYTGTVDLPTGGIVQWQYALPAVVVFKQDWSDQAAVLTALGHPVRLQILRGVLHGTNTVAALVESLETGTSGQMYHHLKELTATGWLASERRGVYEVPAARIVPLLAILLAAGTPG